jgi:hypothetical protein
VVAESDTTPVEKTTSTIILRNKPESDGAFALPSQEKMTPMPEAVTVKPHCNFLTAGLLLALRLAATLSPCWGELSLGLEKFGLLSRTAPAKPRC